METESNVTESPVALGKELKESGGSCNRSMLPMWGKVAVWSLRLIVGSVFLLSGLVKEIDLWGFVFKLEEYLTVWDMRQPRSLVLIFAMGVSAYELVFGFLLAAGCYKRFAPWALTASMAVMLPLTAYIAFANPVSDCGCFGDFWIIDNDWTFIKNLVLTGLLVVLLIYNPRVREGLFKPAIQWMVGALVTLYAIIVGLYGYNIQPMLDFRPFPPGTMLAQDFDEDVDYMPMPGFIYEKDGERREFPADVIPDSTWTFVERTGEEPEDVLPPALTIYDGEADVTDLAISSEGLEILLVIPELRRADISYTYYLNELCEKADSAGIPMVALIGDTSRGIEMWKDISMASYPCYSVENTRLKELSRGIMSFVLLDSGRVVGKSTVSALAGGDNQEQDALLTVEHLKTTDHSSVFLWLSGIFASILFLLFLFQGLILALRASSRRRWRNKRSLYHADGEG